MELAPPSIRCQSLLQSGKSYTMDSLLPAVVAKDAMFGVGKQYEPVIMKLNALKLVSAVGCLAPELETHCVTGALGLLWCCWPCPDR